MGIDDEKKDERRSSHQFDHDLLVRLHAQYELHTKALESQIEELEDFKKEMRKTILDYAVEWAVIKTKVALYSALIGGGVALAMELFLNKVFGLK